MTRPLYTAHQKVVSYVQLNLSTLSKILGTLIGLGILLLVAMFLPEVLGVILAIMIVGAIIYNVVKWVKTNVS